MALFRFKKWHGEPAVVIHSINLAMLSRKASDLSPKGCVRYPHVGLSVGSRICDNCRKHLGRTSSMTLSTADIVSSSSSSHQSSKSSIASPELHDQETERLESLKAVNLCLEDLGETPITMRKARSKTYSKNKMATIAAKMDRMFIDEIRSGDDRAIIEQLKEKFHAVSERSVKIQILTILTKSWSIEKIQEEFGATNFMVRKAKQLVKDKGVLSSTDPQPGHCLAKSTVDRVAAFYESDNSSRTMPGKKDFVSNMAENKNA